VTARELRGEEFRQVATPAGGRSLSWRRNTLFRTVTDSLTPSMSKTKLLPVVRQLLLRVTGWDSCLAVLVRLFFLGFPKQWFFLMFLLTEVNAE
jgi:hypothetical protein